MFTAAHTMNSINKCKSDIKCREAQLIKDSMANSLTAHFN